MQKISKPVSKNIKIIAAVIAGIVVLCCVGATIVGMVTDDKPKAITTPVVTTPPAKATASPSPTTSPVVPVTMPNVTGQNAAIAQDTLKKAGFTNITLGSADPNDSLVVLPQNWTVKEQSTAAGETIPSDTLIVLTCTKKR